MTPQLTEAPPPPPVGRMRNAFYTRFGGLPRSFWIIFCGLLANRVGNMVVPFLVFFLGSRGIPAAQTGVVAISLGVGGMFGPVLGGFLADRIGRKFTVVAGLVLTPAGLGALFVAQDLVTLAIAGALIGFSANIPKPAASALVTDVVAPDQRMKAFSLIHWAINIGTAVASAAAGFLAASGYWILFLADGVTCLAFACLVAFGIRTDTRTKPAEGVKQGGYGVVFRDRLMVVYLGLNLFGIMIYAMTEFAIPLAIRLDGLSPAVYGVVGVTNAIGVVTLQPVLYAWLARYNKIHLLAAAWLFIGIGVASTGLADHVWQYVITVIIWTLGEIIHGTVAGAIVADLAPVEARGRYLGAFDWVWAMSRLGATAVASSLFSTLGGAWLWWGCVVIGLFVTVATLGLRGAVARRTEAI